MNTIRKLSNSFNAPLAALHDLGYYTLAQPVPEEHGITFHGKTTKGFRKTYKDELDDVPQNMLDFLKARGIEFHGGTMNDICHEAIAPNLHKPNGSRTIGCFYSSPNMYRGAITIAEFAYAQPGQTDMPNAEALFLESKLYKASDYEIKHFTHHEIGHAFERFLAFGDRRKRYSHRPTFQKALAKDIAIMGGKEHARKQIGQMCTDPDYHLDPQEVFAYCYAQIVTGTFVNMDTAAFFPNCYGLTKNLVDGFSAAQKTGPEAVWDFYYQLGLEGQELTPQHKAWANEYASIQLRKDIYHKDFKNDSLIAVWKKKTSKSSLYSHISALERYKNTNTPSQHLIDNYTKLFHEAMQEKTPKIPARRPRPPSRFNKKAL